MGVLGKDLFDMGRSRTHTKIEFGADCYWVESNPEPQPYGAVLTETLNLDVTPFQELLDNTDQVIETRNYDLAPRAYMYLAASFASLPLYRLYMDDFKFLAELKVEDIVAGEARDAFAEFVIDQRSKTPDLLRRSLDDIRFIQRRYAWFLDSMFEGKAFEKKKGQRKEPLAEQITAHCLDAFVSGVSLGEDRNVDAPQVNTQYAVREVGRHGAELVEKMYFDRLLDFVYVEFMKGLQKGFVPKRCANCGRWFLQTPGATYSYCSNPAPGMDDKTCREIGATTSFQDKVRNNDVWKLHQRAYKKYFARTNAGTMTKLEFEKWSREAERLRDNALIQYNKAKTDEEKKDIAEKLKRKLNSR